MKFFAIVVRVIAVCVVVTIGVGMVLYLTPGPRQVEGAMTNQDSGAPADLALIDGVIYTGDSAKPRVEAIACRGEQIVATRNDGGNTKIDCLEDSRD